MLLIESMCVIYLDILGFLLALLSGTQTFLDLIFGCDKCFLNIHLRIQTFDKVVYKTYIRIGLMWTDKVDFSLIKLLVCFR